MQRWKEAQLDSEPSKLEWHIMEALSQAPFFDLFPVHLGEGSVNGKEWLSPPTLWQATHLGLSWGVFMWLLAGRVPSVWLLAEDDRPQSALLCYNGNTVIKCSYVAQAAAGGCNGEGRSDQDRWSWGLTGKEQFVLVLALKHRNIWKLKWVKLTGSGNLCQDRIRKVHEELDRILNFPLPGLQLWNKKQQQQ